MTAETAVALPAMIVLVLAALTGVVAVTAKLRCVDAAREAALAGARGEAGVPAGTRVAPDGASVSVSAGSDVTSAVVRATVRPLGRHLPGITVEGSAVVATEPGSP